MRAVRIRKILLLKICIGVSMVLLCKRMITMLQREIGARYDNAQIENQERHPHYPTEKKMALVRRDTRTAVFKEGVLGNYEPKDVSVSAEAVAKEIQVSLSDAEKKDVEKSINEFGSNVILSDKISLDRIVPDTRLDECKYWHYPEDLPTASVVMVFHNEGWSTLLRTVHSAFNRSPPSLLKEIILIDDFSDKIHLKSKLEEHIQRFQGKVRLVRNNKREGAIRSRVLGATHARAEVVVFLDAHCECNYNWLPPLLTRVAHDRTVMAVPIVDFVYWNTFEYVAYSMPGGDHPRGIFEWGLAYKEKAVPDKELNKRRHRSEPYWSPTHAGGLFAMNRSFFLELGGYDPGLRIWGGEQYDLSFRVWMCGGSIEWVPCSRAGHVYRKLLPYKLGDHEKNEPVLLSNHRRVAEIWMGEEYKEYFYRREPTIRDYPGLNITDQLQFKKDHNCKSFDWYMKNVAYDVYEQFPLPRPNKAWGEIKEKGGNQCWDSMGNAVQGGTDVQTSGCHHYGGFQMFRLNDQGLLIVMEVCVFPENDKLTLRPCGTLLSGPWQWDQNTSAIKDTSSGKCVELDQPNKLKLMQCSPTNPHQQWTIKSVWPWIDGA